MSGGLVMGAAPRAGSWRTPFAAGVAAIGASQASLAIAGLVAYPFLTRHLGPGGYGSFSLLLTIWGLVYASDVARPLLTREQSAGDPDEARTDLGSAALFNLVAMAGLGAVLGAIGGGGTWALVAAVFAAISCLASPAAAQLAATGSPHVPIVARNVAWSVAFLLAAAVVFGGGGWAPALGCFFLARVALTLYLRSRVAGRPGVARVRWSGVAGATRVNLLDLLGFKLVLVVLATADRFVLYRLASPDVFGEYAAAFDLVIKVNVFSSAVGALLEPALARRFGQGGTEAAGRHLLRVARWSFPAVGFVLTLLSLFSAPLLATIAGAPFADAAHFIPILAVGVLLQFVGFLLVPWRQAVGDFRSQRQGYGVAAVAALVAGLLLVPVWGAYGAAAAYLVARVGDLWILRRSWSELRPAGGVGWREMTGFVLSLVGIVGAGWMGVGVW